MRRGLGSLLSVAVGVAAAIMLLAPALSANIGRAFSTAEIQFFSKVLTQGPGQGVNLVSTEQPYFAVSMTADAAMQPFSTVRPDGGTDGRFDVLGANEILGLGIYVGTAASVQGIAYPVAIGGITYTIPQEDVAVTRGHHLIVSATAGYVNDSATAGAASLNIGKALFAEAVSATIDPAGCTGAAGCINTALNTPNAGPAGQITLAVNVATLGWAANDPVVYWNSGGTTPTGLTDGNVYWLLSVATTNVTIAASKGGAVVVPSSQGTDATQYLLRLPKTMLNLH